MHDKLPLFSRTEKSRDSAEMNNGQYVAFDFLHEKINSLCWLHT